MERHFEEENDQGATGLRACEVCEALCLDAVDGTLSPAEQAAFELHVAGCTSCAEQFAEARRGAAWMELLKTHRPEPSSALLANILARTSGIEAAQTAEHSAADFSGGPAEALRSPSFSPILLPVPSVQLPSIAAMPPVAGRGGLQRGKLLMFKRKFASIVPLGGGQVFLQPRLAMTAAMAFFSLALTMSMTGTRISDLRPGAIHRTVADAGANAVRSFQSLSVVYQVEAKVSELREDGSEQESARQDAAHPDAAHPDAARQDAPLRLNHGHDDMHDPSGPFGQTPDRQQAEPVPATAQPKPKPVAPNGSSQLQMPVAPVRQHASLVVEENAVFERAAFAKRKGA